MNLVDKARQGRHRLALLVSQGWWWLAVPIFELQSFQIEQRFQAGDVVIDDGEILILYRTANLQGTSSALQELEACIGRVDAAGGQDREARQSSGDGRDCFQSDRPDRIAGHAAVRGPLLFADRRPGASVGPDAHQSCPPQYTDQ